MRKNASSKPSNLFFKFVMIVTLLECAWLVYVGLVYLIVGAMFVAFHISLVYAIYCRRKKQPPTYSEFKVLGIIFAVITTSFFALVSMAPGL